MSMNLLTYLPNMETPSRMLMLNLKRRRKKRKQNLRRNLKHADLRDVKKLIKQKNKQKQISKKRHLHKEISFLMKWNNYSHF